MIIECYILLYASLPNFKLGTQFIIRVGVGGIFLSDGGEQTGKIKDEPASFNGSRGWGTIPVDKRVAVNPWHTSHVEGERRRNMCKYGKEVLKNLLRCSKNVSLTILAANGRIYRF